MNGVTFGGHKPTTVGVYKSALFSLAREAGILTPFWGGRRFSSLQNQFQGTLTGHSAYLLSSGC